MAISLRSVKYRLPLVVALVLLALLVGACGGGGGGASGTGLRAVARYIAGPANESEYAVIFGSGHAKELVDDAINWTARARSGGVVALERLGTRTMTEALENELRQATSGVVTLIGHNDGGVMVFPDGARLALANIGLRTGGAKVAVVSCESSGFVNGTAAGLPDKLAYEAATLTERKFVERLSSLDANAPLTDIQAALSAAFDDAVREQNTRGVIVWALRGAGVGVASISIYVLGVRPRA